VAASTQLQLGSARRVQLATPTGPIAALAAGDPDGRPALLVPGYTGSKEDFGPILDPLADAGLFPVAIDLPGQFESPGPADPAGYRPDVLAEVLVTLGDAFEQPPVLLGHSFGGLVARSAVLAAPSLFESLVLLCSGPAAIGGRRRAEMDALDPVLAAHGQAAVYAAMQQSWQADPAWVAPPPDLAAFLERRFLASSVTMLRGMGDAIRAEPDRVGELANVDLAILVAHGADDDAWPPAVQAEMADRLGAKYVVIPAAAHSPAVENPAGTVQALLDFWQ
jgi:pimeloyl-ACP methyl ester carboxylesterase